MSPMNKDEHQLFRIVVITFRGATIFLGWSAILSFQYQMVRARTHISSALAFAGLRPYQDPTTRFDSAGKDGWINRREGPLHVAPSGRGRRRLVNIATSNTLRTFSVRSMADPDSSEDTENEDEPVQPNFDQLFTGMPKINEILGPTSRKEEPVCKAKDDSHRKTSIKKEPSSQNDDLWLEQKLEELKERYDQRLEEAVTQLDLERQENPESVPDSAYDAVESMLKEEMETELSESREQRFQDILREAEERQMEKLESTDFSGIEDPVVEEILKEANAEADRVDALQSEMSSFSQYEQDALRRAEQSDIAGPDGDADLDKWALNRLEDMLASQEDNLNGAVSETLKESIEELRDRIVSKKDSPLIQPETMKEFQMYHAIKSRLSKYQKDDMMGSPTRKETKEDEEAIAAQLQSWKEFKQKEEEYRRQSGLASGVKIPFEWQEAGKDPMDALKPPAPVKEDNRSRSEIRDDLNRKALAAMENLLNQGTIRSERVEQKIEQLKKDMESPEELVEEETKLTEMGPVDLSEVLGSGSLLREPQSPRSSTLIEQGGPKENEKPPVYPVFSQEDVASETLSTVPPPETPFFSFDDDDEENELPSPPPDTPFFSSDEDEGDVELRSGEDKDTDGESKLGTLEEQKLRSMYRRAGARTAAEQKKIRTSWEEYQKYEKENRDLSGLSDTGDPFIDAADRSLVSDAIKDDGDIDAAKVLAAIGPRPTKRGRNVTRGDATSTENPVDDSFGNVTETQRGSNLYPSEVSNQLFRAVAAVGGGRTRDDPEAKAKEKAEFEDYLHKEEEARKSLDAMDSKSPDGPISEIDDVEYAEKVLESIGPRPEVKVRREISSYEQEYSDGGGAISDTVDDDDDDDEENDVGEAGEESIEELLPEWFRKEETKGQSVSSSGDIGEAFLGNDEDNEEDEFEKNIRQAEEFGLRRSSSGGRQMGIDISDVLGRRGNKDYNDYSFDDYSSPVRDSSQSCSNFRARKANLLEYTELNLREVNALMDHKESPSATGVSQYVKKINKPFRDFGAIFRLEGSLVDISGLQYEAWKRVAESYSFKPPELEDVRLAAVTRPEISVRKIFFWSDDLMICRDAAVAHRAIFRDVFDEWSRGQRIATSTDIEKEEDCNAAAPESTLGDVSENTMTGETAVAPTSETESIELQWRAWTNTAAQRGFEPPSLDDVMVSSVLSPADAVREIFKWASDSSGIADIVNSYQSYLKELLGSSGSSDNPNSGRPVIADEKGEGEIEKEVAPLSQTITKLDFELIAWTKTAWECGFDEPNEQEAWAATVINDPYAVVEEGFCWSDNASEIKKIVSLYKDNMKELLASKGRVEKELEAWTRTAVERGLRKPMLKEALAAWVIDDPHSVVEKGFAWSEDPSDIEDIVALYRNKMDELDGEYGSTLESPMAVEQENEVETNSPPKGPTEEEMFEMQVFAWTVAAEKHGFNPPLLEEIQVAATLDEGDAIRRLFRWSDDDTVISKVSATFKEAKRKISEKIIQKYNMWIDRSDFEKAFVGDAGGAIRKSPSNDEIFKVSLSAWTEVANNNGYSPPSSDQVLFAMTVGPEDAVMDEFEWTNDLMKAKKIAELYKDAVEKLSAKLRSAYGVDGTPVSAPAEVEQNLPSVSVVPGAGKWIGSLLDVEMPCAVVSYLERDQVDILLEYAGLAHLFPVDQRVSASNGYGLETQQLLGAALRMERRPDHCVFFDTTPESAVIAHEVDMKCVNMIGVYPMYDLLSSDSTARYFDDLTAMNLRRLFGERVYDQPMLDRMETQPNRRRKVKTRFWEEGDRL